MKDGANYVCPRCSVLPAPEAQNSNELLLVDGMKLDIVSEFYYLGDMIGATGGAEDGSRTRARCGWKKFDEVARILTLREASHKLRGKIYNSCVRRQRGPQ